MCVLSVFCVASSAFSSNERLSLVTFDGAPALTFHFTQLNDPVMGGRSHGTWSVNRSEGGFGVMDGEVVDVPFLQAPGFIKAAADGTFPHVGSVASGSLELLVRSTTPEYPGFRVTLASGTSTPSYACSGGGTIPFSRGCYKASFKVLPGTAWRPVLIPFSDFSDLWSPATGDHTRECADEPSSCVTASRLNAIERIEIWAEGAAGNVHLEVKAITAVSSVAPTKENGNPSMEMPRRSIRPPALYDSCSAEVQPSLRYGISGRSSPDVPVSVDPSESLAEAVCCDTRTQVFAEPQFLFAASDVSLFSKLNQSGTTSFYDSVCGIELFRAPVNRSVDDFYRDTQQHGWPSFRLPEVVLENVLTNTSTGMVTSKCGTHLGSYLPDDMGPRWCMDLACISGHSAQSLSAAMANEA